MLDNNTPLMGLDLNSHYGIEFMTTTDAKGTITNEFYASKSMLVDPFIAKKADSKAAMRYAIITAVFVAVFVTFLLVINLQSSVKSLLVNNFGAGLGANIGVALVVLGFIYTAKKTVQNIRRVRNNLATFDLKVCSAHVYYNSKKKTFFDAYNENGGKLNAAVANEIINTLDYDMNNNRDNVETLYKHCDIDLEARKKYVETTWRERNLDAEGKEQEITSLIRNISACNFQLFKAWELEPYLPR